MMRILLSLVIRLILTAMVAFALPVVFFSGMLTTLVILANLPVVGRWFGDLYGGVCQFLAVFGEGEAMTGILVIATTGALAGLLFESLNLYRQSLLANTPYPWQKLKTVDFMTRLLCRRRLY